MDAIMNNGTDSILYLLSAIMQSSAAILALFMTSRIFYSGLRTKKLIILMNEIKKRVNSSEDEYIVNLTRHPDGLLQTNDPDLFSHQIDILNSVTPIREDDRYAYLYQPINYFTQYRNRSGKVISKLIFVIIPIIIPCIGMFLYYIKAIVLLATIISLLSLLIAIILMSKDIINIDKSEYDRDKEQSDKIILNTIKKYDISLDL